MIPSPRFKRYCDSCNQNFTNKKFLLSFDNETRLSVVYFPKPFFIDTIFFRMGSRLGWLNVCVILSTLRLMMWEKEGNKEEEDDSNE